MDYATARRNMIETQIKTSAVTDPLVIEALTAVPREPFIPAARRAFAYVDEDMPVGKGRHAMEPMVLARLLQLANVEVEDRALVVAAGTGYSAAVLAKMVSSVVAVESDSGLASQAREACASVGAKVNVVTGDPAAGCPEHGPYDVIVIDGAVAGIPAALEACLRDGGRLVAIVKRGGVGRATAVTRVGDASSRHEGFDAMTPVLPEFAGEPKFTF